MQSQSGTQVSIFGQVYHIQGGQDPEYARRVAQLVDEKMNLIASQVQTPDSYRVAVLAALHLADQCLTLKRRLEGLEAHVTAKSDEMVALLEKAESELAQQASSAYHAVG